MGAGDAFFDCVILLHILHLIMIIAVGRRFELRHPCGKTFTALPLSFFVYLCNSFADIRNAIMRPHHYFNNSIPNFFTFSGSILCFKISSRSYNSSSVKPISFNFDFNEKLGVSLSCFS